MRGEWAKVVQVACVDVLVVATVAVVPVPVAVAPAVAAVPVPVAVAPAVAAVVVPVVAHAVGVNAASTGSFGTFVGGRVKLRSVARLPGSPRVWDPSRMVSG
jgi:hypothetical protein